MTTGTRRVLVIVVLTAIAGLIGFALWKDPLLILAATAAGAVAGAVLAFLLIHDHNGTVARVVREAAAPIVRDDTVDYEAAALAIAKVEVLAREQGLQTAAIALIETIDDALLQGLDEALARFDVGSSERHEIVKIPTYHLPKLVKEYADLNPAQRQERETAFFESLTRMKAEIERIGERVDTEQDMEFGTRQRVTENKYAQ